MSTSDQVNILMVDDQPAKLLIYETILADLEVNLIKATSARQALEHLLKDEIAIVLMDVSMPEIDGFELAAMIRQHPRYNKTAIVFISAVHLTDLDRLKGYEVGAVDYLPVPVIPEILRAKVSVFADLFRKTRQLEALNRDLEQRVEERTAALEASMERERQARLAAEAAARARDEFLSVAAHELRTPVTGLRATAQLIVRRLRKGQAESSTWLDERLGVIDQQTDRLARLVEQLLDVSRLDQGVLQAKRTPTDLAAMAEKLVAVSRARVTKHTVVLAVDPNMIADVDPIGIEQVMSNLLDNAIKYSPEGGQIDIEIRALGDDHVRMGVRDRGIGIPEEKRAAIFERFYRAHGEQHRSGLGLGLYITRQIVELHDGKITAEFPSDGGTRFIVDLPVKANALVPIRAGSD